MVLERFAGVLGLLGSSCGSRGVCRERLGRILGRNYDFHVAGFQLFSTFH